MKLSSSIAIGIFCAALFVTRLAAFAQTADEDRILIQADRAVFQSGKQSPAINKMILDDNFTWTDSSGNTRDKSETLRTITAGKSLVVGTGNIVAHEYGKVGIIQENSGKVYVLRVWIRRDAQWHLLVYQAVEIGAPPSSTPDNEICENPCNSVPFHARNAVEQDVIHTYQAVERAVTAHDSRSWGSHIAYEFFAVTSNSDRPLDKSTRMAGLDHQKAGGISPFPLVAARMFEFGDTMIMTSRQQPVHGLPLHVTRVWFKRHNAWVEAYSYQTTIQQKSSPR